MRRNSFESFEFDKADKDIDRGVESESPLENIKETEEIIADLLYHQEREVGSQVFDENINSLKGIKESVVYQKKNNIELDSLSDNRIVLATLDRIFNDNGGFVNEKYPDIYKFFVINYAKERIDQLDFSKGEGGDLHLFNGIDEIISDVKEKLEGKEIISEDEFDEMRDEIDLYFERRLQEDTPEE